MFTTDRTDRGRGPGRSKQHANKARTELVKKDQRALARLARNRNARRRYQGTPSRLAAWLAVIVASTQYPAALNYATLTESADDFSTLHYIDTTGEEATWRALVGGVSV